MSAPEPGDPGQSPKPGFLQSKTARWLYGVLGLIMASTGVIQVYHVFFPSLPGCTSDATNQTLREIFKEKNVQLTSLTDQKTITESSSEETCQANFVTPAETGTLYYRIYWQDKSPRIQITKVDTHPRQ